MLETAHHLFLIYKHMFLCMSRSKFGRVHRHGLIVKNLGIGSLMFASKPNIGFETVSRWVTRLAIMHHQWRITSL